MAIAFVQSAKATANGASTIDVSLTGVGAGNTLISYASLYKSGGSATYTGVSGGGATWNNRQATQQSEKYSSIWEGQSSTGGSVTVTHTPSVSADLACVVAEFSGLVTTGAYDVSAEDTSGFGSDTAPNSTATATTAEGDELLVGIMTHNGATISATPGGSFTQLSDILSGASTAVCAAAYRIVSATGTYSSTWTLGASQRWCCAIATFKAAAGGGARRWILRA